MFFADPLPSIEKDEERVRAEVHDQSAYLQSIQSMRLVTFAQRLLRENNHHRVSP